ncbi:hypothetical protein FGO68_gene12683 [Halteria grandinella]|uniref:Uncharacterized protein n=1 Tax=Halteria grandinella TaxID=5974 RepID=A0A8J8NFN8_HALGN|nr:hypothetical protein FGO68_gene12683 [Halteria grandinella]
MGRRLSFAVIANQLENHPSAQVQLMVLQSVGIFIYIAHVRPFDTNLLNDLEIFNEVSILFATYHLFLFTDYADGDVDLQYLAGWSMVGLSAFNISINMLVMVVVTVKKGYAGIRQFIRKIMLKRAQAKKGVNSTNEMKHLDFQQLRNIESDNAHESPVNAENQIESPKRLNSPAKSEVQFEASPVRKIQYGMATEGQSQFETRTTQLEPIVHFEKPQKSPRTVKRKKRANRLLKATVPEVNNIESTKSEATKIEAIKPNVKLDVNAPAGEPMTNQLVAWAKVQFQRAELRKLEGSPSPEQRPQDSSMTVQKQRALQMLRREHFNV